MGAPGICSTPHIEEIHTIEPLESSKSDFEASIILVALKKFFEKDFCHSF